MWFKTVPRTMLKIKGVGLNRAILKPVFWYYLVYVERCKHCKLNCFPSTEWVSFRKTGKTALSYGSGITN